MKRLLINNGHIIDPASGMNRVGDLLIEGGKIKAIGRKIAARDAAKIDARRRLVVPGLVDMHVHLRDPGRPDEETIESGARAALAGGFASIVCMANTDPPIDNDGLIRYIIEKARHAGLGNIYPVGTITKGRKGNEIAEFGKMLRAGAVAFSDDGDSVANTEVLRRALEYAKRFKTIIIEHCQDKELTVNAVLNEGPFSTTLGLRGWPAVAEEIVAARDVLLAGYLDAPIHITHVSTRGAVEIIRRAKKDKVRVTADTCPHYFTLTDQAGVTYDTNCKVNPPLRSEDDRKAIIAGLKDGTIDAIASDHAPHAASEKEVEFDAAPSGIIGLETALALVLTELVGRNKLTLKQALAKMTIGPARILGLKGKGRIGPGMDADITIIDPDLEWTYDPRHGQSLSRNTPFAGRRFRGKAVAVIVGGQIKFK